MSCARSQLSYKLLKCPAEDYQLIRSLEIDNFRCFKSARLPDLRRFTVVTGTNGSGKTAFLESLFCVGGGSAEIYLRANAWRGRDIIGVAPTSLLPIFEDFFHQFDSETGLRISFKDSFGNDREVRVSVSPSEVISLPFEPQKSEVTSSRDVRFSWRTPKGTIESTVEVTTEGLKIENPKDVFFMVLINSATAGTAKDNAERWSALSSRNLEKPVFDHVHKLFPEVEAINVLSLGGIPTIHASVRGIERKIPIGLLSAGITKFIAILVAIGSAAKGAILIDEIENGLYYKLYKGMWEATAEFAVANNTQVFATTHSKEFLEAIEPVVAADNKNYSLLRMEKRNGETEIASFSGKEFAGAIKSGFEVR